MAEVSYLKGAESGDALGSRREISPSVAAPQPETERHQSDSEPQTQSDVGPLKPFNVYEGETLEAPPLSAVQRQEEPVRRFPKSIDEGLHACFKCMPQQLSHAMQVQVRSKAFEIRLNTLRVW